MHERLFLTDADNTLWDTDAVYRNAQLALLGEAEAEVGREAQTADRLAFLRELDQLLAQRHHSGLRYPPALLVRAVKTRLQGARPDQAIRVALREDASDNGEHQDILQVFFTNLGKLAPLRLGVVEGLTKLASAGQQIVIATEGPKEKIESILAAHGLSAHAHSVLSAAKGPPLYLRLAKTSSGLKMMVGDQLDRDIEPAKAAGFVTAWFPGGFTPRWSTSGSEAADLEVSSFEEAADAFLRLSQESRPPKRSVARGSSPRQQVGGRRRGQRASLP